MKKLWLLLFLFSCNNRENTIMRVTHPEYIPAYVVGDTISFRNPILLERRFVVTKVDRRFELDTNPNPDVEYEVFTFGFVRLDDSRIFNTSEPYIRFLYGFAAIVWENCFSGIDDVGFSIPKVREEVVNGKKYSKCLTINRFCGDTLNPMSMIYDLQSGVVSFTDSSNTRWDLVPK